MEKYADEILTEVLEIAQEESASPAELIIRKRICNVFAKYVVKERREAQEAQKRLG